MVDARKYFGAAFVTLKEVAESRLRVTIDSVAPGQYDKLNVIFREGYALSLNATNTRDLAMAYGPDTDDWPGHVVELYAGEVEFQGKLQPAVRVKPISPPLTAEERAAATANLSKPAANGGDMGDEDIPF
jgi:hypothetical protein